MKLTSQELYQAYEDLGDFWEVFKQAFDPSEVEANFADRYKGVMFTYGTPIPDNAVTSADGDAEYTFSSGFALDQTAKKKIADQGMQNDTGVVMSLSGNFVPTDFAKRVRQGLQELGLKAAVVQDTINSRGSGNVGVYIDTKQPNFARVMHDLHLRLPETDMRLVNHTAAATSFADFLRGKLAEYNIEDGAEVTLDNVDHYAEKAVFYTVTEDILQGVDQELSSRSMITQRRFNSVVNRAYGSGDGFSKLIEEGYVSEDRSDPVRAVLMDHCQRADTDAYKASVIEEFEKSIGRNLEGGWSRIADQTG